MKRTDPKVDPMAGDHLRRKNAKKWRHVLSNDGFEVRHTNGVNLVIENIHSWRRWAKNAEVVHRAED